MTDGSVLAVATLDNAGLLILDGTQNDAFVYASVNNTGVIKQSGTVYFEYGV
jgi:hypothetical protein